MPATASSPSPLLLALALPCLAGGCDEPTPRPPHLSWVTPHPFVAEPGRHDVTVESTRMVAPSAGLPAEVVLGDSRNNLDVVRHDDGRVYFALRTSPDHFASENSKLYVVSSTDETTWTFETEVAIGTDVREPRLLSVGGRLFLFYAILGTNPLKFEPLGARVIEKTSSGWSAPVAVGPSDYIPWRTRAVDGVAYMTGYTGGEHIYDFTGDTLDVLFYSSANGADWAPYSGPSATIYVGGASETDFGWDARGDLYFVMRTEALDVTGVGSKICVAPRGRVEDLYCRTDPKKYDSPLVFEHDGELYVFGRRNVTDTGYFGDPTMDYSAAGPGDVLLQQLDYRNAPKRCSLWRIVRSELRLAYLLDLPSNGDTCFVSVLDGATPDEVVAYNYSSDPFGPELSWIDGQSGVTNIYRHALRFTPR